MLVKPEAAFTTAGTERRLVHCILFNSHCILVTNAGAAPPQLKFVALHWRELPAVIVVRLLRWLVSWLLRRGYGRISAARPQRVLRFH